LGINKATVSFHIRRLALPVDDRFGRRYDWTEIRVAYDSGLSARACRERFGCARDAWNAAVQRGEIMLRPRLSRSRSGTNNRLENLELLCANCHSQTETYGGRNGHRRKKAA
jgi:hypothetical protein